MNVMLYNTGLSCVEQSRWETEWEVSLTLTDFMKRERNLKAELLALS